jgi:hypothetical protein
MKEELGHSEKVFLYTLYHLESLMDKGLIEGPKTLMDEGRRYYEEVLAPAGFRPTEGEITAAMRFITSGRYIEILGGETQ